MEWKAERGKLKKSVYEGKPPQSEMALKFVVLRRLILNIKLLEISSSLLNPGNFVNNNAILTAGGKAFAKLFKKTKVRFLAPFSGFFVDHHGRSPIVKRTYFSHIWPHLGLSL